MALPPQCLGKPSEVHLNATELSKALGLDKREKGHKLTSFFICHALCHTVEPVSWRVLSLGSVNLTNSQTAFSSAVPFSANTMHSIFLILHSRCILLLPKCSEASTPEAPYSASSPDELALVPRLHPLRVTAKVKKVEDKKMRKKKVTKIMEASWSLYLATHNASQYM